MKLSLAGWSLHPLFRDKTNPMKLIDFPAFTLETFGIDAVELNSPFFESRESAYLTQLRDAAAKAGVKLLNIAVDEKGDLSGDDEAARQEAVANYTRWIPVAREIGCTAIRANSGGREITDRDRAIDHCIDSFRRLADEGRKQQITILIENHWGLSADPDSMVRVVEAVRQSHGEDAMGTMPDYGNWPEGVDRFEALRKILPYAGAVHAKTHVIDEDLNHPDFDLKKCVQLTREAGYDGYLGIESEQTDQPVVTVQRAVKLLTPLL